MAEVLSGQISATQQEFHSRKALGAASIIADVVYFGDNGGVYNAVTNFAIAGGVPKNWKQMTIYGFSYHIGIDVLPDVGNVIGAIQDARYVVNVAGKDYMRGKLGDLFDFGFVAQSNTGEIGATGVGLVAPQVVAGVSGNIRELDIPIKMQGLDTIQVTVHFNTDIAGLHGVMTDFCLSTILNRQVVG